MKKKELLVIIPAYNEETNIVRVLDDLEQPEIAEIADVLVMNDASSDATNWIVKARGHALVTHVFKLGYGSALQLGYKYAIRRGYRYVIQMVSMMRAISRLSIRDCGKRMQTGTIRISFSVRDSWREVLNFRYHRRRSLHLSCSVL